MKLVFQHPKGDQDLAGAGTAGPQRKMLMEATWALKQDPIKQTQESKEPRG